MTVNLGIICKMLQDNYTLIGRDIPEVEKITSQAQVFLKSIESLNIPDKFLPDFSIYALGRKMGNIVQPTDFSKLWPEYRQEIQRNWVKEQEKNKDQSVDGGRLLNNVREKIDYFKNRQIYRSILQLKRDGIGVEWKLEHQTGGWLPGKDDQSPCKCGEWNMYLYTNGKETKCNKCLEATLKQ